MFDTWALWDRFIDWDQAQKDYILSTGPDYTPVLVVLSIVFFVVIMLAIFRPWGSSKVSTEKDKERERFINEDKNISAKTRWHHYFNYKDALKKAHYDYNCKKSVIYDYNPKIVDITFYSDVTKKDFLTMLEEEKRLVEWWEKDNPRKFAFSIELTNLVIADMERSIKKAKTKSGYGPVTLISSEIKVRDYQS